MAFELFGPNNYDECVVDRLKGLSTNDGALGSVRQMCRNKFPKLKSLKNKKPNTFTCSTDSEVIDFEYKNGDVYMGRLKFKVISSNEEKMILSIDNEDLKGNAEIFFGSGIFQIKWKNRKDISESSYYLSCIEPNL
jgi:hypothetical protein